MAGRIKNASGKRSPSVKSNPLSWDKSREKAGLLIESLNKLGDEGRDEIAESMVKARFSHESLTEALSRKSPKADEEARLNKLVGRLRKGVREIQEAKEHRRAEAEKREAKKEKEARKKKKGKAASKRVPGTKGTKARAKKAAPGKQKRRPLFESKTAGVKWQIKKVVVAWDAEGKPVKYKLEPKITKEGRTPLPPSGTKEGQKVCVRFHPDDDTKCTKWSHIPRIYTHEFFTLASPRKRSIPGVNNDQKLYPILPEKLTKGRAIPLKAIKPNDLIPSRQSPRFEGETYLDRRVYEMGIKISHIINVAEIWYAEHSAMQEEEGGEKGKKVRVMRGASVRKTATKRRKESRARAVRETRKIGERAKMPSGVKRKKGSKGRAPKELREMRERRLKREQKEASKRRKIEEAARKRGKKPPKVAAEKYVAGAVTEAEGKGRESEEKKKERWKRLGPASEHDRRETARKEKSRKLIEESRRARGLPMLDDDRKSNPPLRLTKAQKEGIPAKLFGLSKDRSYPLHTIRFARQSMSQASRDFERDKITKAQYGRVMKKGGARIDAMIEEAMAPRFVNPDGASENPLPAFMKKAKADPLQAPKLRARESVKLYMKMRRMYDTSVKAYRPRWDYLLDAYDAAENARANFELAKMVKDARSAQGQKRTVRSMILAYLEQCETGEIAVEYGPTSRRGWWQDIGLDSPPETIDEAKHAYREMVSMVHPDKPGGSSKKMQRAKAGMTCAKAYLTGVGYQDNPPKSQHKKQGIAFLKKSQTHWEKYYKTRSKTDLIAAYKHLVLAEQELKSAGDKVNLKSARAGLKAAMAEMKERID